MSNKRELEDLTLDSWEDVFRLSPEELERISHNHNNLKKTVTGMRQVAKFHALDFEDTDSLDIMSEILRYAKQSKVDSAELRTILSKNPVATFSRVKDTKTGMYKHGKGKLLEVVHVYDDGTRIRTFHSVFNEPERKNRALKAQEFYYALAEYAKQVVSEPGFSQIKPGAVVSKYIGRLHAIKPLNDTKRSVSNVFISGGDLTSYLKGKSYDERLKVIEEVSAIDIVMSVLSDQFKNGKGKRLYDAKAFGNKEKDCKREIVEECILTADNALLARLKEGGIVGKDGKFRKPRDMDALLSGDNEQMGVLNLLGADKYAKGDVFFTQADTNIGNTMINGGYTTIDFEVSKEEEVFEGIAIRILESGLYGVSGENPEEKMLPKLFEAYNAARKVAGKPAISAEEFKDRFNFHKKKHLLRLARRYKAYAEKDENPEQMSLRKEVFYNMLVEQLKKEGRVSGIDDERLSYLNRLFNPQSNLTERVNNALKGKNLTMFPQSDINPLELVDEEQKDKNLDRRISGVCWQRRMRKAKYIGIAAALLAAVAGLTGAVYKAVKLESETVEMTSKYESAQESLSMEHKLRIVRVYQSGDNGADDLEVLGANRIKAWQEIFPEKEMAYMAFFDYKTLYEAMQNTGKKDADSIIKYLATAKVDEKTRKRYTRLWIAVLNTGDTVDNWARSETTSWSPKAVARKDVAKEMKEVQDSYCAQTRETSK